MKTKNLIGRGIVAATLAVAAGFAAAQDPAAIVRPADRDPEIVRMEVSGYCECAKCSGWHRDASGTPVREVGPSAGRPIRVGYGTNATRLRYGTIAADLAVYPYGTVMEIPGYGCGAVEDMLYGSTNSLAGAAALKTELVAASEPAPTVEPPLPRVRVWFANHSRAVKWGTQTMDVKVWQPTWKHVTPATITAEASETAKPAK